MIALFLKTQKVYPIVWSLLVQNSVSFLMSGKSISLQLNQGHLTLESVRDFLIKLDIKPLMHLLEKSTFSLNEVIVRLTKIMNRANKNWAHF